MSDSPFMELRFYAVQNSEGKWFRRKGYGGYGDTWTDDPKLARIYNRISPARSIVGFFVNNYAGFPAPSLVEITPGTVRILSEDERVAKAKKTKDQRKAEQNARQKKRDLENAERSYKAAKAALERAKNT